MAGIDKNAGISFPPSIAFEAPQEVMAMPDTSGVYVVAEADAETRSGGPTGTADKQQEPSLEKGKTTVPERKPDWEINVWPLQPPGNMKTFPERKEGIKHTPPDRFD